MELSLLLIAKSSLLTPWRTYFQNHIYAVYRLLLPCILFMGARQLIDCLICSTWTP